MAFMVNRDGSEAYLDCNCGCDSGIRFRVDKSDHDYYCIMSCTNGAFYREQNDTIFRVIGRKLKKIWSIIRNEDFYYSEIILNKEEFDDFRKYIESL